MILVDKVKHLMADWQLGRMRRRVESVTLSFPDDLRKPKHVLVLLPPGLRELTLVKQFLPSINQLFKPADVSLLSTPGVRVHDIYPRKGFQILAPTMEQLTWSGIPKKTYIQNLRDQKFDALLDLNLEPQHFTSAILLSFPKAVRIGRGNQLGDPYYNLEIKTKYLRDERNIYRSLFETLGFLLNRPLDGARPAPSRN
ncbi:hypothetical protein GF377_04045 [candidate division GN15 bacterium]|nr:hypothetical protein [candidate division GN15 bacterium]